MEEGRDEMEDVRNRRKEGWNGMKTGREGRKDGWDGRRNRLKERVID